MTFKQLTQSLSDTMLFTDTETNEIVHMCGRATIEAACAACDLLEIDLIENDRRIMRLS